MSPLFTAIVIILAILAVMGIVVGVANDAINFLNSAIGSKVAPRRTILWIAAAGILVGTLTSSGMMAVSYTHLDVYKRQPRSWAGRNPRSSCTSTTVIRSNSARAASTWASRR